MTKEKDYLFSKELRTHMSKFGNMDVIDAIQSEDFLWHLCQYAGMSRDKFDEIITNTENEKPSPKRGKHKNKNTKESL